MYRDRIRYRLPRGPWQEHSTRDLRHVTITPLPVNVRAHTDGAVVEQKVTRYMLVLEFTGGNRLVIDQERAAQFGETPERLYVMMKELYM